VKGAVLVLALGAAGCSTTHALPHPPRLPAPAGACSIGVASLMDEAGVDHALDLRDYLRAHGPCRRVVAVLRPDDDGVDVVVTGKVAAQLTPMASPPVFAFGSQALGVGLGLAIAGAVLFGVAAANAPAADAKGFVNPGSRAQQKMLEQLGVVGLAVGGGVSGAGISLLIADNQAIREVSLDGRVDVEVSVLRQGHPVAELREHDEVTARGRHPPHRPEPRGLPAASGPLYREVMARVFEHIAARVADVLQAGDPAPVPR
jgi:hypothetical protein